MTKMTITQLIIEMQKLTEAEQLVLNKSLVQMIRNGRKAEQSAAINKFNTGDIVIFMCSKRNFYGMKRIRIDKFNRAGTAVVGYEVNAKGDRLPDGPRWTVSSNIISHSI